MRLNAERNRESRGQIYLTKHNTQYCCCLGIVDSSGLRFYHTKQLRKYDAGVMTVGAMVEDYMVIPPRQESWEATGVCLKECTQEVKI